MSEIENRCIKFQFEDAELLADILCSQDDTSEVGFYVYGRVLVQQLKYGPAIRYLSKCRSPKSYYFLALCYLATSELEKSLCTVEALKKCQSRTPEYPDFMHFELSEVDILKLKGRILETMGDAQGAFDCFSSVVKTDDLSIYSHYKRRRLSPRPGDKEVRLANLETKKRPKRKRSFQSPATLDHGSDSPNTLQDDLYDALVKWGITRYDSLFLRAVTASELYEKGNFFEVPLPLSAWLIVAIRLEESFSRSLT